MKVNTCVADMKVPMAQTLNNHTLLDRKPLQRPENWYIVSKTPEISAKLLLI